MREEKREGEREEEKEIEREKYTKNISNCLLFDGLLCDLYSLCFQFSKF